MGVVTAQRGAGRALSVQLWLLGFFALPFMIMQGPGLAIIPNLYASRFGFDLAQLGLALLIARLLFDAALNPVIGYLSDRTSSPLGRRIPWILIGVAVSVIGVFMLYAPRGTPGLSYLIVWYSVVCAGWTILDVAYTAWCTEITTSYDGRARIAFLRQAFTNAGLLLLAFAPLLFSATSEMDFDVLRPTAWFALIAMPLVTVLVVWRVPQGEGAGAALTTANPFASMASTLASRPFLILLGCSAFVYTAMGCAGALFFLFFSTYLALGSHFTLVAVTSMTLAILSISLWTWLMHRTSKRALVLGGTLVLACSLLSAHLNSPGPYALPLYMAMDASWYVSLVAIEAGMRSMLGDIVDHDELRTGEARAGEFTAAWSLVMKAGLAAGGALGYATAAAFGFRAEDTQIAPEAALGLKLSLGAVPAAILVPAALILIAYPLNRKRTRIVSAALQRRGLRA
jgi:Na+/melibiose symporter-like transporter